MSEREKLIGVCAETISYQIGCSESEGDFAACVPEHCSCRRVAAETLKAISSHGYAVVPKKGGGVFARSYESTIAYADIARPVPANAETA